MSSLFDLEHPFFIGGKHEWLRREGEVTSPRKLPSSFFGKTDDKHSPQRLHGEEAPLFSPLSTRATASPGTPPRSPAPTKRSVAVQRKKRRIIRLPAGTFITNYFDFMSAIHNDVSPPLHCTGDLSRKLLQSHLNAQGHEKNETSHRPILLRARERFTGIRCIAKILRKCTIPPTAGGERLWRDLCNRLLQCPAHPNLLTFYAIFEDSKYYYLFFEELHGGELFDFLIKENAVPEELCKHLIRQILLALEFLHRQCIVHRDVKPENLMFRHKRPSAILSARTDNNGNCLLESLPEMLAPYEIVLIDFDTCRMTDLSPKEYQDWIGGRRRLVGTYGYLAPEVLVGEDYSPASDLWSVGVILYVLMTGVPPVPMGLMKNAKSSHDELKKLAVKGIDFDFSPLPDFPLARDLCIRLLKFHPSQRLNSSTDTLRHPWLLSSATLSAKYYVASPLASLMPRTTLPLCISKPSMALSILSLPPTLESYLQEQQVGPSSAVSQRLSKTATSEPLEKEQSVCQSVFALPILGPFGR